MISRVPVIASFNFSRLTLQALKYNRISCLVGSGNFCRKVFLVAHFPVGQDLRLQLLVQVKMTSEFFCQ